MLAGEPFGSWSTFVSLRRNEDSGVFEYTQALAAGTYRFKWIVDGQWQASPSYPQVRVVVVSPSSQKKGWDEKSADLGDGWGASGQRNSRVIPVAFLRFS